MKKYIIAIDQGTTGTTMLAVNATGKILHHYYRSFSQSYPKPGWVEHDPELIWDTVNLGLKDIFSQPWIQPGEVAAIGLTNQRETIVFWERRSGRPVIPAIVWQCRRTAELCSKLAQDGLNRMVAEKTGLRLDPYFSATKIQWALENVPGLKERALNGEIICGTIDSWLIWKLTGGRVHATEPSNASRTMLFNTESLQWDQELLTLFGVYLQMLPEVKPSAGFFGETDPTLTGGTAIPIAGVLGDQQAALFGQGCFESGTMKNTYGTGCFLLMNTGPRKCEPSNGLLSSIGWRIGRETVYVLEGSVFVGGAVVQWLRDELGILKDAAESEKLAVSVPDNGGVYFVPAFTGLGAPHWDPYARGMIIGLTRGVNRAYLVRASLEAIAYQVGELVECMSTTTARKPAQLRVDGGAAANNFLLQFQADICDIEIQRNNSVELTGLGAAFIAGLGSGFWTGKEELKDKVTLEKTFRPRMVPEERNQIWSGWRRAVERSKGWAAGIGKQ